MKKISVYLACAAMVFSLSACVVPESDLKELEAERTELKKQLDTAKEENKVLNDAIMEIYQERESLVAQIEEIKNKIKIREDAVAAAEARKPKIYKVQPGDSLSRVAQKTGVSMDRLKELNRIRNNMLFVGQELRLR